MIEYIFSFALSLLTFGGFAWIINQIENSKLPVAVSLFIYSIPLTFFWHYLLTNY